MSRIGEVHELFVLRVRAANLPEPQRWYVLRLGVEKWSGEVVFDFAWPDRKIAVRIDKDKKRIYEQAVRCVAEEQGWYLFFFTGGMIQSGAAITAVVAAFEDDLRRPADRRSVAPNQAPNARL